MEVLVAMAVMSVATYLIVGAFTGSVELGEQSITSAVAAAYAEEQISELQRNPSAFDWPDETALAGGSFGVIAPKAADPANRASVAAAPAILPADARLQQREQNLHSKLTWEAYARLPKPDALVYEVSVRVKWVLYGREQMIVLTTAMPKPPAEDGA